MPLPSSVTTRLQYQHKSLIDLIEDLSDEQIRRHIIPGKWSIFENIVHLATYQHAFFQRLNRILSEDNPELPRYTAEADPLFLDNCLKPTREIMQDLIAKRRDLNEYILGISDDKIQRRGRHPVFGNMTIPQWLTFFLLHEAHHLFTVFKLAPELRREVHGEK